MFCMQFPTLHPTTLIKTKQHKNKNKVRKRGEEQTQKLFVLEDIVSNNIGAKTEFQNFGEDCPDLACPDYTHGLPVNVEAQ